MKNTTTAVMALPCHISQSGSPGRNTRPGGVMLFVLSNVIVLAERSHRGKKTQLEQYGHCYAGSIHGHKIDCYEYRYLFIP